MRLHPQNQQKRGLGLSTLACLGVQGCQGDWTRFGSNRTVQGGGLERKCGPAAAAAAVAAPPLCGCRGRRPFCVSRLADVDELGPARIALSSSRAQTRSPLPSDRRVLSLNADHFSIASSSNQCAHRRVRIHFPPHPLKSNSSSC